MTQTTEEVNQTYLRLHRYLMEDYLNHELTLDELILIIWLQWKANPVNGTIHPNYAGLVVDFQKRYSKNYINKLMLSLKRKKYLWFPNQMGRRGSFIVELSQYPLSDMDFKDISHRFEQSAGKGVVNSSGKTKAEALAELNTSQQKSISIFSPEYKGVFSESFNNASRGSKNENKNENENENFVSPNGERQAHKDRNHTDTPDSEDESADFNSSEI